MFLNNIESAANIPWRWTWPGRRPWRWRSEAARGTWAAYDLREYLNSRRNRANLKIWSFYMGTLNCKNFLGNCRILKLLESKSRIAWFYTLLGATQAGEIARIMKTWRLMLMFLNSLHVKCKTRFSKFPWFPAGIQIIKNLFPLQSSPAAAAADPFAAATVPLAAAAPFGAGAAEPFMPGCFPPAPAPAAPCCWAPAPAWGCCCWKRIKAPPASTL